MIEAPAWGPQGQQVFERTYARELKDGHKETWFDTVTRVVDGNLALVPEEFHLDGERDDLFELIHSMSAMPAGRHLWTTGVEGRQYNRNCHRAGWGPRLGDHFVFTFGELLKGGGVGANYSSEYLLALPPILGEVDVFTTCRDDHHDLDAIRRTAGEKFVGEGSLLLHITDLTVFQVEDSREGWCEALAFLFNLAETYNLDDADHLVVFDVSDVRPHGDPIHGFGGVASGPAPLVQAIMAAARILNGVVEDGLTTMTGLDAMEIDHELASCVIAGNTRRSARMSIMHWADEGIFDFIHCKSDTGLHWTTNISVEVDDEFFEGLARGEWDSCEVWDNAIKAMLSNGEPGFYNSSRAADGENGDVRATNPCGEIALEEWESCNLGHINLAKLADSPQAEVEVAFMLMARFLIRATFAELTDDRQRAIEAINRRIGVGIYGFQEWLGALGIKFSESWKSSLVDDLLGRYKDAVRFAADQYCDQLGIPRCIKVTTVAPTGTIAKLSGNTEGIHPVYSRYYERRIRYAENDPALVELGQLYAVEDCVYSDSTKVVVHHVRDSILDAVDESLVESVDEIRIDDLLAVQAMVQRHYADNAVSFTANVDPSLDPAELERSLRFWLPHLKGTTIMPDASRPQSPYTRITKSEYERAIDHEVGQSFDECSTGACPVR